MSTSNNPPPAPYIGRSVYDGKRPLTPAQVARLKSARIVVDASAFDRLMNEADIPPRDMQAAKNRLARAALATASNSKDR